MSLGSELATVRETVSWGVTPRDRTVIAAFYGLRVLVRPLRPGKAIGEAEVPKFWLGDFRARTPNGEFFCRGRTTDFDVVSPRYEAKVLDLVEGTLRKIALPGPGPPVVFVDVGAHIGKYPVFVGRRFGDRVRTGAFEPDPQTFHLLERNLESNGCGEHTRAFNEACGSENGFGHLFRNSEGNLGDQTFLQRESGQSSRIVSRVPVVRLDDCLAPRGLSPVNVLKIDVQGWEMEVLRGAERTISDSRLRLVIIEDDGDPKRSAPLEYLRERGFLISRIDPKNCAATRGA